MKNGQIALNPDALGETSAAPSCALRATADIARQPPCARSALLTETLIAGSMFNFQISEDVGVIKIESILLKM